MRLRAAYGLREWIAALPPALLKGLDERAPGSLGGEHGITEVGPTELQRLSALATPNQVVAIFEKPVFQEPLWATGLFVVLDGLQDPGNLGTIVRLADWFGVDGVLCGPDSADVFNPKAVQSTMGSVSRIPVWYGDPETVIRQSREMPVWAALLQGESLYGQQRIRRGFIVIGNESKGIGPALQGLATHRITIPRIGEAESLNAAVATGIILSHLVG
jgi:TrmH family RNA methyltransferase